MKLNVLYVNATHKTLNTQTNGAKFENTKSPLIHL